jgi:hypothetical protein
MAALLDALHQWHRAVAVLAKGGKGRTGKEKTMLKAGRRVITLLQDPAVAEAVNQLMAETQPRLESATEQLNQELIKHREPLLSRELETIRVLHLSRRQFATLVNDYVENRHAPALTNPPQIETVEMTADYFEQLQQGILATLQAAKTMPRKPKKARKREVTRGATFAAVGLGLLAANTLLDALQTRSVSYILGGNALMKAIDDLLGVQG